MIKAEILKLDLNSLEDLQLLLMFRNIFEVISLERDSNNLLRSTISSRMQKERLLLMT